MAGVRVGLVPPVAQLVAGADAPAVLARAADVGVDHLCVGDHVSFFVGRRLGRADHRDVAARRAGGAARCTSGSTCCRCVTRSRSPGSSRRSPQLAPGRLTLGVGIGGEDPHEIEICGVDPKTRGRRMDECLQILRGLADGTPFTFDGEFFSLQDALIVPAPSPPIPLIVGGRSDAAVSRAARLGDGWLGIWVSPRRYAAVRDQIARQATRGRQGPGRFEHALNVWCGFGHDS